MKDEKEQQEEALKNYVEQQEKPPVSQVGPKIIEVPDVKLPWQKQEYALGNQIGWIPLPIEDLPTRGLFYPKETVVSIRSANGGEIRHWSTLQEEDLSALDDMLNYIIERCVTIKSNDPDSSFMSWKDIKEVDRFYLLLAIHELTFPNGENKLQVKVSDTKRVDVTKDMVSYITLDPRLMKYYDEEERCFNLKLKTKKVLRVDLPSVGVTQWIKNLIIKRQRSQEYIDEDYLSFAPFVIRSWRGLTEDLYAKHVEDSHKWDIVTISLLTQIRKLLSDALDPVIRYKDEGGTEHIAPLNFQGGIKSILVIPDPLSQLE